MKGEILNWLLTGDVGASSKAMAAWVSYGMCDGSYPHDPDDFNRCLKFLNAVTGKRRILDRVAHINKPWKRLVDRWDEIEQLFLDEAGYDWCKSQSAPRTYALMKEVLNEK